MKKLFIHMGPGGNDQFDKKILLNSEAEIVFLSQLKYDSSLNGKYIDSIVKDTEQQILFHSKEGKEKVELIAHSFGGTICTYLSKDILSFVDKVTLLAPTLDFRKSLDSLFTNIMRASASDSLIEQYEDYKNSNRQEDFWTFFIRFTEEIPDFYKYYFSTDQAFQDYLEISQSMDQLDQESFQNGMNELMTIKKHQFISKEANKIKIYLGKNDPYYTPTYISEIMEQYNGASFTTLDAGHFIHFEHRIIS